MECFFNEKYKRYHIGNICEKRFKDIWESEEYWGGNESFSPQQNLMLKQCVVRCLQHKVNEALDNHVKGVKPLKQASDMKIPHINFI